MLDQWCGVQPERVEALPVLAMCRERAMLDSLDDAPAIVLGAHDIRADTILGLDAGRA